MRYLTLSAVVLIAFTSLAQAATLNESDIVGGFSSDFTTPTLISSGFEELNGTLEIGAYNIFSFTDLTPGAQTLEFTIGLQTPLGSSFQNAGGYVRFQETPFQFSPEEGSRTDFSLVFDPFNPSANVLSQTLSFDLDDSFSGSPLFFATRLTFSSQGPLSTFNVLAPGNAVAPVPVPAAGLLLLTALAGAAALRRRKTQLTFA